jgi:putative addiction module component (TIGR02574 family)
MLPELNALSPDEKLLLIEELWDSLSAEPSNVPVLDWDLEEVERRKAALAANPGTALTWEELVRRVRARHGR